MKCVLGERSIKASQPALARLCKTLLVLSIGWAWSSLARAQSAADAPPGEVLYNGIRLSTPWPPQLGKLDHEPMRVPYLESPPEVIPIDVGRQLWVDDFLIQQNSLRRTFHQLEYCDENPILRSDKPWELGRGEAQAMPFSDGVWYDPADRLFKMWYITSGMTATAYATSRDGLHWEKPLLDVEPGTNIVFRRNRDSSTVWLDQRETDPARRFKMFTIGARPGGKGWGIALCCSADGIHWSQPVVVSASVGDRTTVFFNPFRNRWIYSLRIDTPETRRSRAYQENADVVAGLRFADCRQYPWITSDRLDPHNPDPEFNSIVPQLYNLDAAAYESLLVGYFSVWQGPENGICKQRGIQKRNEVFLGFSRDGFHWQRPDRKPFAGVNPVDGAWNWGNVQSVGGGCLVVGDRLYFYVSGRGIAGKAARSWTSTGLGFLRRDGFASMDAAGEEGSLTTRPVTFQGKHLFVNLAAPTGELRAELVDASGAVLATSKPLSGDKTLLRVDWQDRTDLSAWRNKPVRFRFHLRRGSLFAFWVTPAESGASYGYVSAGGPGFTEPRDTVGTAAYDARGVCCGRSVPNKVGTGAAQER
jgi:hypothetical protein